MPHSLIAVVWRGATVAGTLAVLATAALAGEWGHYANARFGFNIDVPPDFVAHGESDNGDGQFFDTPTAEFLVFGSSMLDETLEAVADRVKSQMEQDHYTVTYEASTPSWASFSGVNGGTIIYVRLIPLCGGIAFGEFTLSYGRADVAKFDPVITRLVRSFTSGTDAC